MERGRPIVAIGADTAITHAGKGQEDAVAVGTGDEMTPDAVAGSIDGICVVVEFLPVGRCGCVCAGTEVDGGGIVDGLKFGLVVVRAAVAWIGNILGQGVLTRAIGVVTPIVGGLGCRLAPGEEVAVILGVVGADVDLSPELAAGQAQVDPYDMEFLELGGEGGIGGNGYRTRVADFTVVPPHESVAGVRLGTEGGLGVLVVGAAACNSTPGRLAAGHCHGDVVLRDGLELGGVGSVAGYGDGAGLVGVAVVPLDETVAHSGLARNPDLGAFQIRVGISTA